MSFSLFRTLLLATAALLSAGLARADISGLPQVSPEPKKGDMDEVDDVAGEDEYVPAGAEPSEDLPESIEAAQAAELSLSPGEIRGSFQDLLSFSLGPSKPWQTYTFEFLSLLGHNFAGGAYVGGATRTDSGIAGAKAYDLKVTARSVGATGRYFLTRFDNISFEGDVAYGTWDANLVPHGSNSGKGNPGDKLTEGFRGHGAMLGLAMNLGWYWPSGFFLEWTPLGARVARLYSKDFTRDTELGSSTILRTVEYPAFYGLTDIRCGWMF